MTYRIVVTGPECTGKTTLAAALAGRLGAPWVREASREVADEALRAGRALSADDVDLIARRAMAAEDAAMAAEPTLCILDTDLLSTVAYARHYYGSSSAWLEGEARRRARGAYLLCAPDIPWVADGIRDRPTQREAMFADFARVLDEFGARHDTVRGIGPVRLTNAMAALVRIAPAALPEQR
jgi:NadR type nicotinamide-nucleotide adenylyltransferase